MLKLSLKGVVGSASVDAYFWGRDSLFLILIDVGWLNLARAGEAEKPEVSNKLAHTEGGKRANGRDKGHLHHYNSDKS